MGDVSVFVEARRYGHAVAVVKNERIIDLLIDSDNPSKPSLIGSIMSVKVGASLKGINGTFVTLPNGDSGFLRGRKINQQKRCTVVSVKVVPEGQKAQPVSPNFTLKGRYVILTPFKPGINFSRNIRDEELKTRLRSHISDGENKIPEKVGIIIRSMAENTSFEAIIADISEQLKIYNVIISDSLISPKVFVQPLKSRDAAFREWVAPDQTNLFEKDSSFDRFGGWERVNNFLLPKVNLSNGGFMMVEMTSAFVAIDINSGADISRAACLKTNLTAVNELPAQLQVRGIGGKIIVDFAPIKRKDREILCRELSECCKRDKVEMTIIGWTKGGCLEIQKKRDKPALSHTLIES